jgi:hypothetical protein
LIERSQPAIRAQLSWDQGTGKLYHGAAGINVAPADKELVSNQLRARRGERNGSTAVANPWPHASHDQKCRTSRALTCSDISGARSVSPHCGHIGMAKKRVPADGAGAAAWGVMVEPPLAHPFPPITPCPESYAGFVATT